MKVSIGFLVVLVVGLECGYKIGMQSQRQRDRAYVAQAREQARADVATFGRLQRQYVECVTGAN